MQLISRQAGPLEGRKKLGSCRLSDRLRAKRPLLFAFLLTAALGAHAGAAERNTTAERLRNDWGGAVYLLELRRKEPFEVGKPCDSAIKKTPVWATGFAVNSEGDILTAKHPFEKVAGQRNVDENFFETEVCGWAHVWTVDKKLERMALDLSKSGLRRSETGDYAVAKLQTRRSEKTLQLDRNKLDGNDIAQSEEVYFLGYDGPNGDTPENAEPKSEPKDLQNPCKATMAECDMTGGAASGNSGAPVISKDGKVFGITVKADDERRDRSRFIHIGRLADFLNGHNFLSDNAGEKGVLRPTDAFFTDEEAVKKQSFIHYGQTSVHTAFVKLRLKFAEDHYNKETYFSSFDELIRVSWKRRADPSSNPEVISRRSEEEAGAGEKIWKVVLVFNSKPEPKDLLLVALGPVNFEWKIRDNSFRWKLTSFDPPDLEGGRKLPWSISFAEVEQEVKRPHWMVITDAGIMTGYVEGHAGAALLTATIENPTEQAQTLKSLAFRANDPTRSQRTGCFMRDPVQTVTMRWEKHDSVDELNASTMLGGVEIPIKVEYSIKGECSGYSMTAEVPLSELVPANDKKIVLLRMTQLPWEEPPTGGGAIFPSNHPSAQTSQVEPITSWPHKSVSFSTESSSVVKPHEFRFGNSRRD